MPTTKILLDNFRKLQDDGRKKGAGQHKPSHLRRLSFFRFMGESELRSIGGISNYQENENIEMGNIPSHWILHGSAAKNKRSVAQIYLTPEHCFALCSLRFLTHASICFHSIFKLDLVFEHENWPERGLAAGSFQPIGRVPRNARSRDSQKALPACYLKCVRWLFGQQDVKITPYIPPVVALLPTPPGGKLQHHQNGSGTPEPQGCLDDNDLYPCIKQAGDQFEEPFG
jgi:hypothetical protein